MSSRAWNSSDGAGEVLDRAMSAGRAGWADAWAPDRFAAAPGRVEVLGNHTDYNGGPVLAAAIDRRTVVVVDTVSGQPDCIEIVFSDVAPGSVETISLTGLGDWRNQSAKQSPADYVRGAIAALDARGIAVSASRITVASDVPIGMGVSSSAALCVALAMALSNRQMRREDLVLTAQEAEHRAGTPCGTMDQSASIAGGMILFDAATLGVRSLTPDLQRHAFLVIDSGVKRALNASSYSRRVEECRQALETISRLLDTAVPSLAALSAAELEQVAASRDPELSSTLLMRARHIVSEVARVEAGERAIAAADWLAFGRLMTESGRSSATDYEISHPKVEAIVGALNQVPGVLGARMMGGGEGGSLLALMQPDSDGRIETAIRQAVDRTATWAKYPLAIHRFSFAGGASFGPLPVLG